MVSLWLFCIGAVMLSFGSYHFWGPISVWYLAYGNRIYGAFPSGISMILFAFAISPFAPDDWKMAIILLAIFSLPLGSLLAKRLLKPTWLRWLEQKHGAILPMLRIEIQEIGPETWNRQINTQAELEEWIKEVKLQRKREAMGIDH